MDSFPVEERINSDGVANPLHDVLDWDFSESTETAWSKAQNSRVGRAGRTFGYQANRSRRQFRTHKSASLAVDEDNAYSADSSPDFSRSSGRSVISEQSEPFVPPEEVPARPRRHRQHRSMSMFGSTRPTNLSQSMDLTRATSETSDFTRESSASSMNVESFSEGWQEKSAYLGEGTVCPPRPRRHRQARSMSMFGSTQPSNYIRCHSLNNVDQGPPSFLLPSDETKSFPEWQAKSSPALEETDVALPPQLRLHRSSSMLGSTTPTNLTASFSGSIPPWGENSNPQRVESTLDTKKKDGHERQFKKIRARRHSITGSVPPLSDMKKPSSSTFSHLAQDAGPWGETPATIQKLAFDCRDLSEVPTQSSPERSVASSRKRGVCGSPVRDLEDRSACLSALSTSSSRMTRIFAPEVDIDIPFAPSLKVESSQREMDIDSDDGDDESNASPNESFRSTTSHTEKMVHTSTVDEAKRGTPEFILETMSSYQDLKFLIKALRDKSKKKGPVLHSSSWTVAPPAAWSPTRRSRFLTWAKDCLRFSLRFAGAGAAYLQIPCEMGANVSKNLERALIYHKQNEVRVVETDGDDFGLGSCTKPERSSFEPRYETNASSLRYAPLSFLFLFTHKLFLACLSRSTPAPFSLSCPTPAPPHCDETSNLVSGLESLTMRESSTKASNQKMVRTVTVDPHVPQQVKSRQSLDNHVRSNDLMNHLHGFSPDEQDVKPVRMSFGKPPRLSMGSTATSATSEAVHNIECFAT